MFVRMRKLHNQRGDSIVEVLLAIAIAASVLAITYSIMNRNLLTVRDNQERIEATKLLQGQIEALRNLNNTNPTSIPAAGTNFCLKNDGTPQTIAGGSPTANVTADTWANYTGECTNGFYHLGITTANNGTYRFYVGWDRLGNGPRDQIIMAYKK
jgi:type II secretory pathway pseudopilin PulG